jgi:hypothetical protein
VSTEEVIRRAAVLAAIVGAVVGLSISPASAATVALTLDAVVGPDGTTILVTAPGCEPTPPGEFEIFVQVVLPSGEVGEGAVGAGTFTAPGQGSVLIPGGTPVGVTTGTLLLTVGCNHGTLTGSQRFQLTAPAPAPTPVTAPARFTG